MANITQTIPALTAGISQQPDEQKIPGQVKDLVNAIPDVTQGLLKRPAGKFVASLSDGTANSTANGRWFHYYRDENEQYIGQISRDGIVKMWDCLTGAEKTIVENNLTRTSTSATYTRTGSTISINYAIPHNFTVGRAVDLNFTTGGATSGVYSVTQIVDANNFKVEDTASGTIGVSNVTVKDNYLMHTDDEEIQTLTLNDFTYINNRSIITEMDGVTEPLGDFGKEIFVELKKISYSKQYALNVFDSIDPADSSTITTATRINVTLLNSSNNYCNTSGFMRGHTQRGNTPSARCTSAAGDGRDAFAPNVATRIFSVDSNKTLTDTGAPGGIQADGTAVNNNYSYNVNVFKKNNDGSYTGSQSGRKNLYFRIRTTGQSVPFTTGSGETQTTTYQARYTTTYDLLHGGEGWQKGDKFYVFMADGYYQVDIEEISTSNVQANLAEVRPNPTPFDTETTITAESILGDIRSELISEGISSSDITTIGLGLHIKRSTAFNAATPVGELLNVVSGKVNDVGDLPSQCKHGMVVEVVNSAAEEDNYFVKFFGKEKADGSFLDGEGTWEECAKPGRNVRFKRSRMPIVLIRTADGNFRLSELDGSNYTISGTQYSVPQWDNALVGDDVTNPEPSFIGKNISKMLFFRNRFAMLADEHIVLSRPGDFTNFFAKSAIQLVASDPIDIAASSEYPAILYDGIQVNTGLILFSKNQQFMLTTDSDVFSPTTAKINALSSYNFNFATNPISLGTTIGFLDNAGKFSRFFEMVQVQREGEPQIIEQSAVVSKLFEKDLKLISNSRENSVIFFSEEGTNTLYGYRYFDQVTERKLASWFKWTLTGTIQYHCMQDDNLFVVVRNNNKDQLLKYAIKMDSNTFALAENRVHLDHLMEVNDWTYFSNGDYSIKNKSGINGLESSNQLAAYDVDAGNNLGRYGKITISGGGSQLKLDGNWSNQVNTVTVTNQGSGYTSAPTVTFSGGGTPTEQQATGTATVVDGKVTSIAITDTGSNYTSTPTITISGGGGSSATATAALNNKFTIGYLYTMEVALPTIYYVIRDGQNYRADTRANTILHRVKLGFGPVGLYETTLTRIGRPDYTEVFEVSSANQYIANTGGIVDDNVLRSVPIYDRNINAALNIKSTHPAPATVHNMTWEGVYTTNNYQRV